MSGNPVAAVIVTDLAVIAACFIVIALIAVAHRGTPYDPRLLEKLLGVLLALGACCVVLSLGVLGVLYTWHHW